VIPNHPEDLLTSATQADQPLALTVHSMPLPAEDPDVRGRAGRWKMIAVLLVCASPVIASYFTYYVVRPEGRRNYGELVEPQRPLPAVAASTLEGKPVELTALKGQWLLMSVAGAACDTSCQKRLYFQHQLREALGKERGRLDWVWLINDAAEVDKRMQPVLSSATVLRVPAAGLAQWLPPAVGNSLEDHIYLVDPLGNLMMRFPAHMDAAGAASAKRDLDRLLRASASWDRDGR
jgi:hypothetical protein